MPWITYDGTGVQFNTDGNLEEVCSMEDIDRVIIRQFKNRIRVPQDGGSYLHPKVIFFNENDRVKSSKEGITLTVHPHPPLPWADHIVNYTREEVFVNEDGDRSVRLIDAPIWHVFNYTVTLVCTDWSLFRRMQMFMRHQAFPPRRGNNLVTFPTGGERVVTVVNEDQGADHENNWFRYTLTYEFQLPIHLGSVTVVPTVGNLPDQVEACTRTFTFLSTNPTTDQPTLYVGEDEFGLLPPWSVQFPQPLVDYFDRLGITASLVPTGTLNEYTLTLTTAYLGLSQLTLEGQTVVAVRTDCEVIDNPLVGNNRLEVVPLEFIDFLPSTAYIRVGAGDPPTITPSHTIF